MTPISQIYERFLPKIEDFSFKVLPQTTQEALLLTWLKSATAKFVDCDKDLTIDEINQVIVSDLDSTEKEILAMYMVVEWLEHYINNYSNLKNKLPDRDFQAFSDANKLDKLISLKEQHLQNIDLLISRYLYKKNEVW